MSNWAHRLGHIDSKELGGHLLQRDDVGDTEVGVRGQEAVPVRLRLPCQTRRYELSEVLGNIAVSGTV